jgi:NAD+ diphosphatase
MILCRKMSHMSRVTTRCTFRFCPYDGSKLTKKRVNGKMLPRCTKCDFIDYPNPKPCVALLVEYEGRLLLGKRAINPQKGLWDILGGFVDSGESVETAVRRELQEETGADVDEMIYLGSLPDTYGERRVPTVNLCFRVALKSPTIRAATDVADLRWFRRDELPSKLAFPHQQKAIDKWFRKP